jgi:glycosyltransferase involved in cell wall biosynthesis
MSQQDYTEPYQHIVVCSSKIEEYKFSTELVINRCGVPKRLMTIADNWLAAIPYIAGDKIVCCEDDDWYGPHHLSRICQELDYVFLAGESPSRAYNPVHRRWKNFGHNRHTCLHKTGFRREVLPFFQDICQYAKWSPDGPLWNRWQGPKSLYRAENVVGIKGIVGSAGISGQHRANFGAPDTDLTVFRAWNLPDLYLEFYNPPAEQNIKPTAYDPTKDGRRVVYVLPGLHLSGGVKVCFEHLNRLADRGHKVACASLSEVRPPGNWIDARFPIVAVNGYCKEWQKADVVVATGWQTVATVARLKENCSAQEHFYFVQMRESLFYSDVARSNAAEATYDLSLRPITISRWLKRFLEKEHDEPDVSLVINGIDSDVFYPEPFYPKIHGKFRLCIEGYETNDAKNVRDAFSVVNELKRRGLAVEVYGFSQAEPRFPFDRYWRLPDVTTIRRIYSSCHLTLKTTRFEGRPAPHVESMACGTPVVTTDMLGTDDCEDGRALICGYGDIAGLADACEQLLTNPEQAREITDRARFYVATELVWDRVIDQLEQIYELVPDPVLS